MIEQITINRKEWNLFKQVMRTLTWGKLDATTPWYQLVQSIESRFPNPPTIENTECTKKS